MSEFQVEELVRIVREPPGAMVSGCKGYVGIIEEIEGALASIVTLGPVLGAQGTVPVSCLERVDLREEPKWRDERKRHFERQQRLLEENMAVRTRMENAHAVAVEAAAAETGVEPDEIDRIVAAYKRAYVEKA